MPSRKLTTAQVAPLPCDYDLAAAYVAALTGSVDTVMDWRCLSDTDMGAPGHARRGTLPDLWPWIEAMNAAGYGAFVSVNETDGFGRSADNIIAARAAWVDLDGDDSADQYRAAMALDPAPSFAVQSSPGRWHLYWRLAQACPVDMAESLTKRLTSHFNGDRAATDRARVLRLAGTANYKRARPSLVGFQPLPGASVPVDWLRLDTALPDQPERARQAGRHDLGTPELAAPSLDWLQRALDLIDPNELDRGAWISLSAAVKQAGWSLTDESTLRDMWLTFCSRYDADDPAENEKEWRSIRDSAVGWASLVHRSPPLKAALSFGDCAPTLPPGASAMPVPVAANDDRRQTITASNLFEHVLAGDDEPLRYHIEGLIPEDGLIPVHGPPKQGKTFTAIDMGASVATATTFHGLKVSQGTVFYICGEGFRAIKQRFKAWSEARGVSLEGAPLFRSRCAVQMLNEDSATMLSDAVARLAAAYGPPRLIIVDTLARNFGPGDENSTVDMSRFVGAIDRLKSQWPGCSVIVVHHSGLADTKRARGSSALLGAADAEFRVETNATGPALYCTAMKDAAPARAMQFELIEAGRSVALEYTGEPNGKGERILPPVKQKALDAFNAIAVTGTADIEAWRVEFYKRHALDKLDSMKSAFRGARMWLEKNGHLVSDDSGDVFSHPPMPGVPPPREGIS